MFFRFVQNKLFDNAHVKVYVIAQVIAQVKLNDILDCKRNYACGNRF
jgi:hypothetical protein